MGKRRGQLSFVFNPSCKLQNCSRNSGQVGGVIIFFMGAWGLDVCGRGFEKGKRRGQSSREKGRVNHLLFSILTVNLGVVAETLVREGGGIKFV